MAEESEMEREPDVKVAGLSLWVRTRQFPDMDDFWDGDWLDVRARVEAPGSYVEISGPFLRNAELATFAQALAFMDHNLAGSAELSCIEPNLHVEVSCRSLGHVRVVVAITPDHMNQSHKFEFELDQSYLKSVLTECKRIAERFPVRGAPI